MTCCYKAAGYGTEWLETQWTFLGLVRFSCRTCTLPENSISLASVHQITFLSPFRLRTEMSGYHIQQVLQDRHQQMLSLAAEVVSTNSAFTFIASFPAWLLKLSISSELNRDERAKLFKESSKNGLLQLTVHTPTDSLMFSLINQTQLLTATMPGNLWHSNVLGGRQNGAHFLSIKYYNTTIKPTVYIKYIFRSMLLLQTWRHIVSIFCCIFVPEYPQRWRNSCQKDFHQICRTDVPDTKWEDQ